MTLAIGDTTKTWPTREDYLADVEERRREAVRERRDYYYGRQYDDDNAACRRELQDNQAVGGEKALVRHLFERFNLPEHLRKHAYSTQLRECVDWIADRLAQGFAIDVEPGEVSTIVERCLDNTPQLSASDEDQQRSITTVLREAGKCGDVPVLIRWDATEGCCWLEFWPSEQVEMRFTEDRPDKLEQVRVEQIDWRRVDGQMQQVTLQRVWAMDDGRCVESVYIVSADEETAQTPVERHEWGLPVLPWWLLRVQPGELRSTRGVSLMSEQAMRTADRFNAVEQVSWLIARYNSHGNMVVVGDAAMVQTDNKPIHKDVADVLTFPGGTAANSISLPTDPAMIEHQRTVLLEALYGSFGLVRTDQETVSNLGAVSGYALELLNQRSEVTFNTVRAELTRDIKALLMRVVDCHAAWSAGTAPAEDEDMGEVVEAGDEYPNRQITVHLGTGYVVDKALIRDDYLAGLISQREALRRRGYTREEIDDIQDEQAEEKPEPQPMEASPFGMGASTQAGRTLGDAERREPARNGATVGGEQA